MNELNLEDVVKGLMTKTQRSAKGTLEMKVNPTTGRFNLSKALRVKFDFPKEIALSLLYNEKRVFVVFNPSDHEAFQGKRVLLGKTTSSTLPDGFHSKDLAKEVCKVFICLDSNIVFELKPDPVFNMGTDKFWELVKKD